MHDSDHNPDLDPVVERLRAARVDPTPTELDHARSRALRQAGRGSRGAAVPAGFLRTRLAVVAILVLGLLVGGAGTTLAVSGGADGDNAATAEYHDDFNDTDTLDETGGRGGEGDEGGDDGDGEGGTRGVQAGQQEAATAGDDDLPFTGLAAIPLIVLGVMLLAAGAALQRRVSRSDD